MKRVTTQSRLAEAERRAAKRSRHPCPTGYVRRVKKSSTIPQQLKNAHFSLFPFYLFVVLGTGGILLQFCNIGILNAFWPFFTGLVIQLLAAMFQFVRIILLPPE